MGSDFQLDDAAMKKAIEDRIRTMAADLTQALDRLTPEYKGRPLEDIKAEIQRVWAQHTGGETVDEPDLTRFADMIQQGGSVEIRLVK
ncbi:hypothetical protein ACWC4D_33715 [Streptomyces sp. NPDC001288]